MPYTRDIFLGISIKSAVINVMSDCKTDKMAQEKGISP
jgi:hypothetical protein